MNVTLKRAGPLPPFLTGGQRGFYNRLKSNYNLPFSERKVGCVLRTINWRMERALLIHRLTADR